MVRRHARVLSVVQGEESPLKPYRGKAPIQIHNSAPIDGGRSQRARRRARARAVCGLKKCVCAQHLAALCV